MTQGSVTQGGRCDAVRNYHRILDAARDVLGESGAGASMEEIATRAGVGVGTVYRRFAGKDALIDELVRPAMEEVTAAADQALTHRDAGDPLVRSVLPLKSSGLDESYERSFNSLMGRIAGVTAAETRERLLRAAADVFAERGYDGTRVADIAATAGVSNGALYAHFHSKADLLVEALRTHGRNLLGELFAADPDRPVVDLLLTVGQGLPQRRDARGYLIVEALTAARRDEDVARPMREYTGERADWLAGLVDLAQTRGELDAAVSPQALAHFCLLLAMGSALITPDLHEVGENEWAALLTRVAGALASTGTGTGTRTAHTGGQR